MNDQLTISPASLLGYSIIALPVAMAGIPLYIHAPDFYAVNYGLSLQKIGLMLLILRLIDAVIDPFIGLLSDNYGAYRKQIFIMAILLLASGFYLLFNPLQQNIMLSFASGIFITTISFSTLTINLNALGGIWSDDYNVRTRISTWREGFGLIGLIIAAALPGMISASHGTETFHLYSIVMVFMLIICATVFIALWLNRFTFNEKALVKLPIRQLLGQIYRSISSKMPFNTIYFISILASSIPAVLLIFFIRDRLGMGDKVGLFLATYFLAGAVSMPLWSRIAKRWGKLHSWLYAMILSIAVFAWAYFLQEGDFYPYLTICILSGFAFGAELALPPSILADLTDKNSYYTLDYAILTFFSKLAFAGASGAALYSLGSSGYMAAKDNSPAILGQISFLYALLPCAIKSIAVILLIKTLNGDDHVDKIINPNNGSNHA